MILVVVALPIGLTLFVRDRRNFAFLLALHTAAMLCALILGGTTIVEPTPIRATAIVSLVLALARVERVTRHDPERKAP